MNNALVSIIVPCYNQAEYIAQTLDSILSQTYTNWECIVVDDGSVDNSFTVVDYYVNHDARFRYLYQKNQGPSVARNTGIQQAKGEYILPLDADDLIAPSYVSKAIAVFDSQSDIKLVYCQAQLFGSVNEKWNLIPYSYEKLIWENMIFCSAIYRKSDYEKTDGYNPNMRYGLEDWDFWLTFLTPKDKVFRIEEILFYYRMKDVSRSTQISHKINKELLEQIYYNHQDIYASHMQDIVYLMNERVLLEMEIQEAVYEKELEIRSSKAYRLGKAILKPFGWLKKILIGK